MAFTYPWTNPPWTPQQVYHFIGTNSYNSTDTRDFCVLAGTAAATITAGWPKIQTIDRARRLGFTMPTSYDPYAMDVAIRFVSGYGYSPNDLEDDILDLEWMAGRGYGITPAGDPPMVQLETCDGGGNPRGDLIPRNAQQNVWFISQIQYDNNPLRAYGVSTTGKLAASAGSRTLQDATVSLTQRVQVPGAPNTVGNLAQTTSGGGVDSSGQMTGYTTVTSTDALDTVQKICQSVGLNTATAWTQVTVLNYSLGNINTTSYLAKLPKGTKVQIPNDLLTTSGAAGKFNPVTQQWVPS